MPTSERTKTLRALGALENEDRYIVGNARCLSEGVDVPALDGVAFVDPRRSEIDIIQAVGRAIRLSEGKETGTIVIPVFIADEDDPDEVLSSSQFDQVWKVVNALRSHDETLGEMLDQFRVGLGRKQKVSFKDTKIVFDVPTRVSEEFVEAFETKLVETTTESWEFWFNELLDFSLGHGHTVVQRKGGTEKLGRWASKQRGMRHSMAPDRRERLEQLGFIWDVLEYEWLEMFDQLKMLYAETDSQKIPKSRRDLGSWADKQRRRQRNGELESSRIMLLEAIGFDWDPFETAWHRGFDALSEFRNQFGSAARISQNLIYKQYQLGKWVSQQRVARKNDQLPVDKIKLLDSQHFVWNQKDADWDYGLKCLQSYVEENSNALVPSNYKCSKFKKPNGTPFPLGTWVHFQRSKQAKLNEARIARLTELGFVWSLK